MKKLLLLSLLAGGILCAPPAQATNATLPTLGACSSVATGDIFLSRHGSDTSDCKAAGSAIASMILGSDAEISALAGLTSAADKLPYFTGSGTASLATFTAAGRALVDDADAAAQWVTLGNHASVITFHAAGANSITWTSMPAAATILNSTGAASAMRAIRKFDLTNYAQCRLSVTESSTAGAAGAKLIAKYSTSFASGAGSYSDLGTSEISTLIDTANTNVTSSWINIAAGAKADDYLTIVGSGGDGSASPVIATVELQCR